MKTTFQFHSRSDSRGEILAQSVTFLPPCSAHGEPIGKIYMPKLQHLAGFLPVLNFHPEKVTLAQPLLKELSR